MPTNPIQPPYLRLGSGQSASGLQHAYGNTIRQITATNAANGWKQLLRIGPSLSTVDLSTPGNYTINNVPFTVALGAGTINTLEQTSSGVVFDLAPSTMAFIMVKVTDLWPTYQLGQRLRSIIKFKTDNIPDLEASGLRAQICTGYGNLTRLVASGNQINPDDGLLKRASFGGTTPPGFVPSTGTQIDQCDQVIAFQGSHPGWQGFYLSQCDEDSPDWRSLTADGGIYTAEGDALLTDGAGTGFDASTDNIMFALLSGPDAGFSGIAEYFDVYLLDEGT